MCKYTCNGESNPRVTHVALTSCILSVLILFLGSVGSNILKLYLADQLYESRNWFAIAFILFNLFILNVGLLGVSRKSVCALKIFSIFLSLKLILITVSWIVGLVTFVLVSRGIVAPETVSFLQKCQSMHSIPRSNIHDNMEITGQILVAVLSFFLQLCCVIHARRMTEHILAESVSTNKDQIKPLITSDWLERNRPVNELSNELSVNGVYLVPVYVDKNSI
eukprot:TRINITY_DN4601_c0_g1_i12.p1 TRINITY_DN4601_c0_g1~~TRINITY_DN4601_c0_g1_i12.p1  ORF type:complete len:222 (+),score=-0.88 TRINITY_DN4601_c0_g1_i12:160-825(+)